MKETHKIGKLSVTTKMTKLWAEHKGIDITSGAGKRAGKRKASIDLTKAMGRGEFEEAKEVLGDKLYAQMTRDATVDGSKLSPAVSPNDKMNAQNDLNQQNQAAKTQQPGSINSVSNTDAKSIVSKGGDVIQIAHKPTHAQKFATAFTADDDF
jgi:hypothetical protein